MTCALCVCVWMRAWCACAFMWWVERSGIARRVGQGIAGGWVYVHSVVCDACVMLKIVRGASIFELCCEKHRANSRISDSSRASRVNSPPPHPPTSHLAVAPTRSKSEHHSIQAPTHPPADPRDLVPPTGPLPQHGCPPIHAGCSLTSASGRRPHYAWHYGRPPTPTR